MKYTFQCTNETCSEYHQFDISMDEIQDTQTATNGKEKPKCPSCETDMKRSYSFPHLRQFKGRITPSEVKTADGKIHKLSSNLYRN